MHEKTTITDGELHVVLGVNGNVGFEIAKLLVEQGKHVRGVTRSGTLDKKLPIEVVQANALDLTSLKESLSGASVIYHAIGAPYSKWSEVYPRIMDNLIKAATDLGSHTKVVYVDNLYMYGKEGARQGPVTEDTPELADGKKGKLRASLAAQLMQAHKAGQFKATIGRASDFFGPGATNSILDEFVFPQVVAKKKIRFTGNLDAKHDYMYLPDFAKAIVTLAQHKKAFGEVWVLPHLETQTQYTLIQQIAQAADYSEPVPISTIPSIMITLLGLFNKDVREVKEVLYQTEVDWTVDSSKFEKNFDFTVTPLDEAITETLNWYSAQS